MAKMIGFATEFYTLWDVTSEHTYRADAYGTYHVTGTVTHYNYIKNISKDLDKVKELYPSLTIDENLRGITRSWKETREVNLPDNFFWYGKYAGKKIDEILESDMGYCLWAVKNYPTSGSSVYIQNSPIYLAHCEKTEQEERILIEKSGRISIGELVELNFISNGFNYEEETGVCYAKALFGETEVFVKFPSSKLVGGMYPYIMPSVNGKPMKTKGKTLSLFVVDALQPMIERYNTKTIVRQHITIK